MTTAAVLPELTSTVHYNTVRIGDVDVFYREAGSKTAPVLLLLHGFPTSSNMFRNLIPRLAGTFRVIAPDYPGYGFSGMPDRKVFSYTFENMTTIVEQLLKTLDITAYSLYVMDYGAPIGYRLALRHPERIRGLVVQNGNAYDEGLLKFWDPIKKYWRRCNDGKSGSTRIPRQAGSNEVAIPERSERVDSSRSNDLDPGPGTDGPSGQRRHPAGHALRLPNQRSALSSVPGVLPEVSASNFDCLGQERLHFSARGRNPVQTGSSQRSDASTRHGSFCPRDSWRGNRFTYRALLWTSPVTLIPAERSPLTFRRRHSVG